MAQINKDYTQTRQIHYKHRPFLVGFPVDQEKLDRAHDDREHQHPGFAEHCSGRDATDKEKGTDNALA